MREERLLGVSTCESSTSKIQQNPLFFKPFVVLDCEMVLKFQEKARMHSPSHKSHINRQCGEMGNSDFEQRIGTHLKFQKAFSLPFFLFGLAVS